MYKTIAEFKQELKKIADKGYVESLRSSDTGIGYTLETYLGLKENNIPLPDLDGGVELKAFRKDSPSLLTLFTCEPQPEGGQRDRSLLERFGYKKRDNLRQKELYCTINSSTFNPQSLKLEVEKGRIKVTSDKEDIDIYWVAEQLKERFLQKIPKLIVVKADARMKDNGREEFCFNEAYFLKGFSFESFKNMIAKDIITVDFRMHLRENGTVRNHGTAFRVRKSKLEKCFQELRRLV
ncbi:MAG: MvaI/BcnI family restriction endonuclease [Candidatus Omnitrophota bacterium]